MVVVAARVLGTVTTGEPFFDHAILRFRLIWKAGSSRRRQFFVKSKLQWLFTKSNKVVLNIFSSLNICFNFFIISSKTTEGFSSIHSRIVPHGEYVGGQFFSVSQRCCQDPSCIVQPIFILYERESLDILLQLQHSDISQITVRRTSLCPDQSSACNFVSLMFLSF